MSSAAAMFESSLSGFPPPRRGKVRDLYDLGDRLLLVATDRISAFDAVFPTPIPWKGRVLTSLTLFWLDLLSGLVPHHLISASTDSLGLSEEEEEALSGRALLVRKAEVIPFECIVRGYLAGSGWQEYRGTGGVCGIRLPAGLRQAEKLPEPIFTPSTKAESGHDRNVDFRVMADAVGREAAARARELSLAIYAKAAEHAREKGIIIADTKFEFGFIDGQVMLVDEALTPDSSRFWPADQWRAGRNPPSYDKQHLRDWLENESGWNKEPPAPPLPEPVVAATRSRYLEAYARLSGRRPPE